MKLSNIKGTVQAVAEAISAAVGIETEIVGDDQVIVAGTGRYANRVGTIEECGDSGTNEIYGMILRTGTEYIIEDAVNDPNYWGGEGELAEVCCPIKMGDKVIGIIGLVAFTKVQQELLVSKKENLLDFCGKMGFLIASKAGEVSVTQGMRTILEAINKGIVSVDKDGVVLDCNHVAMKMLGYERVEVVGRAFGDFWATTSIMQVLETGTECKNIEERYTDRNGGNYSFLSDIAPIFLNDDDTIGKQKCIGAVITFSNMVDVHKMVYDMTEKPPTISYNELVGDSEVIVELKEQIRRIAYSKSTVLITGESGTGKGLIAKTIHFSGNRQEKPFITVNCGALPDNLIESELFGYEEGSFTGAKKNGKPGKFERAHGGTMFLDEIGDLPLHLQVKLLHVLQTGKFERIGGTKEIYSDVRIIAATNKNLEQMVKDNEFREDLYFRFNVIPMWVPPIRERKSDLLLLLNNALNKYNLLLGKSIGGFSSETIDVLMSYRWPGNVRELENVVEYAINMEDANIINRSSLPQRMVANMRSPKNSSLEAQMGVFESRIIKDCLSVTGYTVDGKKQAAELLGIGEATLYRKLKSLNIDLKGANY